MLRALTFKEELGQYFKFLFYYFGKKTLLAGKAFEQVKSLLVSLLIAKRGKYQQSFLNISFFLLVVIIYLAGPIIAENNPILGNNLEQSGVKSSPVFSLYSMNVSNQTTTNISQKPRDGLIFYTILSQDTLSNIAKKFDVSVETIKWANDLEDDTIVAGKTLKIPPVSGMVHKVASGDTVYSIAKKYNTDAQKIVNFPFNEFADQDTFSLTIGQTLFVPDGTPEQEKPAVYQLTPQYFAGQTGSGNFIWPTTGLITQYSTWYHTALDIANAGAPAILASDAGVINYADCINWGYGCHIIIDHGNGYQTLYGHLSNINVGIGQNVGRGDTIGIMGSTGRSTGTHLHFEIRQNGALLNPLDYLR